MWSEAAEANCGNAVANAILFPRVLLPLYIFEPRYKQMLADCLKGERMFAVALLRKAGKGRPQPHAPSDRQHRGDSHVHGAARWFGQCDPEGVARVRISDYVKQRPISRRARRLPGSSRGRG